MSKKNQADSQYVITAFLLNEGSCVFFQGERQWTDNINDALIIQSKDDVADYIKIAKISSHENVVVDLYSMAVEYSDENVEPIDIREKVRVHGPSIEIPSSETY